MGLSEGVTAVKGLVLREHNFLCAFILSEKFCNLFYKIFKPAYFQNADYKTLVSYIFSYFEKYNRPPRKLILSYMEKHRGRFQDESLYQSLLKTLASANESIDGLLEKYDSQFLIDDAELFIKAAELKAAVEDIDRAIEGRDEEGALKRYSEITIPSVQKLNAVTFEDDLHVMRDALNADKNFLFQFPDSIGRLAGPFYRGDFFAWVAPTGTGKSWLMQWTAKKCREAGLNVLFLSLEMQMASVLKRFGQLYFKRSLYGEDIDLPKLIEKENGKFGIMKKHMKTESLKSADIGALRNSKIGKHPHGRLKIVCQAGIAMPDLRAILSGLKYQSRFIPDVVILDYADKMTLARRTRDERETLGVIWKDLRDLALSENILVVTASQTNRAAWDKHFTRMSIADDSRKLNEVSGAVGIMATPLEHENGLLLLRLLKVRDGWSEHKDLYCLGSFNIGQPVMQTCWASDLDLKNLQSPSDGGECVSNGKRGRVQARGLKRKKRFGNGSN